MQTQIIKQIQTVKKNFLRSLGVYLCAGVILLIYGTVLTGCAPMPLFPPVITLDAPQSLAETERAVRQENILARQSVWEDEEETDPLTRGITAFGLAIETHEPYWSKQAIIWLKPLAAEHSDHALATAYLGSSHALAARDYPVKGWWLVIPGPGFVRLYHVKRAFTLLDRAVASNPDDPVVRLIRASTFVGLRSFGDAAAQALEDFELLQDWVTGAADNPNYADVIAGETFRHRFTLAYAESLTTLERTQQAAPLWQEIAASHDNPLIRELAQWHIK